MAFCRWLSRRLNKTVRLPDEWEWQCAATGGDPTRTYPWGSKWNPKQETHRANTFESHLRETTAVGMFPAGVSLAGPYDMAGSVWEWCLNKYENPEITESRKDDLEPRVVRGGSWSYDQDFAKCANRYWDRPTLRFYSFGFRVVCTSVVSDGLSLQT